MKNKTTTKAAKTAKPANSKKWYEKIYTALFDSKFTAIVALMAIAGLAVYGLIGLIGDSKICIAVSVVVVIMLANKVVSKLK